MNPTIPKVPRYSTDQVRSNLIPPVSRRCHIECYRVQVRARSPPEVIACDAYIEHLTSSVFHFPRRIIQPLQRPWKLRQKRRRKVLREERLMRCEVLQLRGGEERARGVEGSRVLSADVEGVLVNL